jgi:hypothetical protein
VVLGGFSKREWVIIIPGHTLGFPFYTRLVARRKWISFYRCDERTLLEFVVNHENDFNKEIKT